MMLYTQVLLALTLVNIGRSTRHGILGKVAPQQPGPQQDAAWRAAQAAKAERPRRPDGRLPAQAVAQPGAAAGEALRVRVPLPHPRHIARVLREPCSAGA